MRESWNHDVNDLRRVLGAFPSGVTVIASLVDGKPVGMAASSFTSVSLDPPLVSVCIAHTSRTGALLSQGDRWGISVLGEDQEAVCRQMSSKDGNRFEGVGWRVNVDGTVLVKGAAAWLDCTLERRIPAGDHDIVLLRVRDIDISSGTAPLVFHGSKFRNLKV